MEFYYPTIEKPGSFYWESVWEHKIEYLKKQPESEENKWLIASMGHFASVEYLIEHADKLNWRDVSANPCVSMEMIYEHPELPWNPVGIAANPNVTFQWFSDNYPLLRYKSEFEGVVNMLCCNSALTHEFLDKYPNVNWNKQKIRMNCPLIHLPSEKSGDTEMNAHQIDMMITGMRPIQSLSQKQRDGLTDMALEKNMFGDYKRRPISVVGPIASEIEVEEEKKGPFQERMQKKRFSRFGSRFQSERNFTAKEFNQDLPTENDYTVVFVDQQPKNQPTFSLKNGKWIQNMDSDSDEPAYICA